MIDVCFNSSLDKECISFVKKALKHTDNPKDELESIIFLLDNKKAVAYKFIENNILIGVAIVEFLEDEFFIYSLTLSKGVFKEVLQFLESRAKTNNFKYISCLSSRKGFKRICKKYGWEMSTYEDDKKSTFQYQKEL